MRPEKTDAIILHTYPFRERDKIVVFLTPGHGKKKGRVYGVRSGRSRFGAALEPLARVQITFLEKENDELVRVDAVDLVRSLFPAQQQLLPSLAATYFAEHADTFAQPDDPSELIFRLLDRSSLALLAGLPVEPIVAYFEVWLLRLAGTFPSIRECGSCHASLDEPVWWDEGQGVFVCRDCAGGRAKIVPNEVTRAIQQILRLPVEELAAAPPAPEVLFEIRAFSRWLRRNFLGQELRSHDLLQAMLGK